MHVRISNVLIAELFISLSLLGCSGGSSTQLPPPPPSPASLSDGTIGAAYTQTVQTTGGVLPFHWSVSSGALPLGLMLVSSSSSSVTISGTPSIAQPNVAFTIQVTDSSGQSAKQSQAVNIKSTVSQIQYGGLQGVLVPCGAPKCSASNVLEFRGIPYAAPPVGGLRWKPTQPPIGWTGTTRDATVLGNRCIQVNGAGKVVGSEDCLYLNVFVSSQTPHSQPQPVMVYLHGGANRIGTGLPGPGLDFNDPPPLATQGVIVVTLEYRLGILGFFTHPLLDNEENGSSGNYGLKDQIAALAWVHQNIASFGGAPSHGLRNVVGLVRRGGITGISSHAGAVKPVRPVASLLLRRRHGKCRRGQRATLVAARQGSPGRTTRCRARL
jgi:hypothetical protein